MRQLREELTNLEKSIAEELAQDTPAVLRIKELMEKEGLSLREAAERVNHNLLTRLSKTQETYNARIAVEATAKSLLNDAAADVARSIEEAYANARARLGEVDQEIYAYTKQIEARMKLGDSPGVLVIDAKDRAPLMREKATLEEFLETAPAGGVGYKVNATSQKSVLADASSGDSSMSARGALAMRGMKETYEEEPGEDICSGYLLAPGCVEEDNRPRREI